MLDLERETANDLAFSLIHNPSAWSWNDDRSFLHGPNGIGMSATFMTIYRPVNIKWRFMNRRRIRRAFKAWKRIKGNDLASQDHDRALTTLRRCLTELRAVA